MIVRKRLSDAGNLVWEFELENNAEEIDIVIVMYRGVAALKREFEGDQDVEEFLEAVRVWEDAVSLLAWAKPGFEKRLEYPKPKEVIEDGN